MNYNYDKFNKMCTTKEKSPLEMLFGSEFVKEQETTIEKENHKISVYEVFTRYNGLLIKIDKLAHDLTIVDYNESRDAIHKELRKCRLECEYYKRSMSKIYIDKMEEK